MLRNSENKVNQTSTHNVRLQIGIPHAKKTLWYENAWWVSALGPIHFIHGHSDIIVTLFRLLVFVAKRLHIFPLVVFSIPQLQLFFVSIRTNLPVDFRGVLLFI